MVIAYVIHIRLLVVYEKCVPLWLYNQDTNKENKELEVDETINLKVKLSANKTREFESQI